MFAHVFVKIRLWLYLSYKQKSIIKYISDAGPLSEKRKQILWKTGCTFNKSAWILMHLLRLRDATWRHKSESTLDQAMAPWLEARSLNQYWRLISEVLWYSYESNLTACAQATVLYNEFESHLFEIIVTSPMVNELALGWHHDFIYSTK